MFGAMLKMVLRDVTRSGNVSRIHEGKHGFWEDEGKLSVSFDSTVLDIATDLDTAPDAIMLEGVKYVRERPNMPLLALDRAKTLEGTH